MSHTAPIANLALTAFQRWRFTVRGIIKYKPVDVVSEWPDRLKRKGSTPWGRLARLTPAQRAERKRKYQREYQWYRTKAQKAKRAALYALGLTARGTPRKRVKI